MKSRSEVLKNRTATKSPAAERTVPLPFAHKLTCDACEHEFETKNVTQREDGTIECPECGNPMATAQWPGEFPKIKKDKTPPPDSDSDVIVSSRLDTTSNAQPSKLHHPDMYCGDCGAKWTWEKFVGINGGYAINCGHITAIQVDDPRKAKKLNPPAGHPRPDPPKDPLESRAPFGTPAVTLTGNRLSITWGECRFPVDQFNSLKVGQIIMTVEHAPDDDRVEVARRMLSDMQKIQDLAFDVQSTWYKNKLKTM